MSNWGKAHINNTNGFGQAARNSGSGYGSVYDKSESGDTNLTGNPPYFAMTIDTTKLGTPSDQFQFTGAEGEYEVDAVQNDVVQQSYTGLVDEQTITLPSAGIYQVRVKPAGTNPFNRIAFKNNGDSNKVLSIDSFGIIKWSSFFVSFRDCSNLTTSETNPDLSNLTSLFAMFIRADIFNSNISSWDTSNVITMREMFNNASSFKQDISAWNVEQVNDMAFMFANVDMNIAGTTTNYDNLLIKWSQQNVQPNVDFGAGNSKYDPTATLPGYSVTAGAARAILVSNGWTIKDGGTI